MNLDIDDILSLCEQEQESEQEQEQQQQHQRAQSASRLPTASQDTTRTSSPSLASRSLTLLFGKPSALHHTATVAPMGPVAPSTSPISVKTHSPPSKLNRTSQSAPETPSVPLSPIGQQPHDLLPEMRATCSATGTLPKQRAMLRRRTTRQGAIRRLRSSSMNKQLATDSATLPRAATEQSESSVDSQPQTLTTAAHPRTRRQTIMRIKYERRLFRINRSGHQLTVQIPPLSTLPRSTSDKSASRNMLASATAEQDYERIKAAETIQRWWRLVMLKVHFAAIKQRSTSISIALGLNQMTSMQKLSKLGRFNTYIGLDRQSGLSIAELSGRPSTPASPNGTFNKPELISAFNADPAKAIQAYAKSQQTSGSSNTASCADDIVAFIFANQDRLDKTKLGELLGQPDELSMTIMHTFIHSFDFAKMEFTTALRKLMGSFRLPGEAQKIDRIMNAFADHYCDQNQADFANPTVAYILSFSLIMLNTDAHNPAVVKKMSLHDFLRNNRGIDDGKDLPATLLKRLYYDIVSNEIKLSDDSQSKTIEVLRSITGARERLPSSATRTLIAEYPAHQVSGTDRTDATRHERTVFLFNDCLIVAKMKAPKRYTLRYLYLLDEHFKLDDNPDTETESGNDGEDAPVCHPHLVAIGCESSDHRSSMGTIATEVGFTGGGDQAMATTTRLESLPVLEQMDTGRLAASNRTDSSGRLISTQYQHHIHHDDSPPPQVFLAFDSAEQKYVFVKTVQSTADSLEAEKSSGKLEQILENRVAVAKSTIEKNYAVYDHSSSARLVQTKYGGSLRAARAQMKRESAAHVDAILKSRPLWRSTAPQAAEKAKSLSNVVAATEAEDKREAPSVTAVVQPAEGSPDKSQADARSASTGGSEAEESAPARSHSQQSADEPIAPLPMLSLQRPNSPPSSVAGSQYQSTGDPNYIIAGSSERGIRKSKSSYSGFFTLTRMFGGARSPNGSEVEGMSSTIPKESAAAAGSGGGTDSPSQSPQRVRASSVATGMAGFHLPTLGK